MKQNENKSEKEVTATDQDLRTRGKDTPAPAESQSGNTKVIPDKELATKRFTEGSNLGHDSNVLSPVPDAKKESTHVEPEVSDRERWVSMPSANISKV